MVAHKIGNEKKGKRRERNMNVKFICNIFVPKIYSELKEQK